MCDIFQGFMGKMATFSRVFLQQQLSREHQDGSFWGFVWSKFRTPLNWVEPRERRYYGIDFVIEAKEQVRIIQQHMKAAQSRQKSYADKRRRPIEFEVGDYVHLKVSPMKKVQWYGVKRKLAPKYAVPYKIIEWSGRVAYKL